MLTFLIILVALIAFAYFAPLVWALYVHHCEVRYCEELERKNGFKRDKL